MKRRNAESGKMRRPVKRTKITEGMYGNSMVYLKLVLVWAAVVLADYLLEFRFELLWPFWMMLRSLYDSFKYQGLAFSVFFICIALTSDMICFFFIPLQYIFFAASTYVWVQYVWYTFADKGICLPTVLLCCVLVYVEGALRADRGGGAGGGLELCRPLAAHCVGYPVVTLGFGVKSYVGHRLRLRRQKQVRAENEFYFRLMREALPESALESQNKESPVAEGCAHAAAPTPHMNGSLRRAPPLAHAHTQTPAPAPAHTKLEKIDKKCHAQTNGAPPAPPPDPEDRHDIKISAKSTKCEKKEASTVKEEKKKNRNRDKDKDNHSDSHNHKGTEQTKEQIVKEIESTKENHIRNYKDYNSYKEKESHREREKEREMRERERENKEREREIKEKERENKEKERENREKEKEIREKEREKERERERELRERGECLEELRRVKAELAAALRAEAEARRALAAAAAADRQRAKDHHQLKQAHAQLQHKISVWRTSERAALERRLGEERRARTAAEHQLRTARQAANRTPNGEVESGWSARRCGPACEETLRTALDRADRLQLQLHAATAQLRTRDQRPDEEPTEESRLAGACAALQERASHLERSLSAETRVKLDLLSALGDAKRQIHIQEGLISRQEKEIEELKAQMLAVLPPELVGPVGGSVSKMRLETSPLDPNASVYTPKQLCSDA